MKAVGPSGYGAGAYLAFRSTKRGLIARGANDEAPDDVRNRGDELRQSA